MKRYWTCSIFEPRCARRMCPSVLRVYGTTWTFGHEGAVFGKLAATSPTHATKACGTTGFFVVGGLDTREPYGFWHFDRGGIETRASAHELEVCPTQHRYLPRTS